MFDAVVVGGGAAGMMAAITAAERGKHVLLLEKNAQLGRKIRITGKGRCNVTNNCEPRTVIESTPGNGRFLYGAVNHFTPQDTMDFFEGLGVPRRRSSPCRGTKRRRTPKARWGPQTHRFPCARR